MPILKLDQLPTLRQLYENHTLVSPPKADDVDADADADADIEFPASEEWLDRVSL